MITIQNKNDMKTTFLTLAAVATMLAACNNNDSIPVVDEMTDTPIVVNAGIAELTSRAGMTTGDLVDLGLHIENEANTKYSFVNVEFEKDADTDGFVLSGTTVPLWQNATQKITVWAYSPYNAGWTDLSAGQAVEVKTTQNVEADVKASDLLWAKAEVDPTATVQEDDIKYNAGALDITLNHIFSKLTVNVRFGDEFPNMMIAKDGLTIEGFKTTGKIKLSDASISNLDNEAAITAYKPDTQKETFEAILLPQEVSFSVNIALYGGRTFQWEHQGNFTFGQGKNYTLNLVVGKDKVEIADDGISAKDWIGGTTGSLETE